MRTKKRLLSRLLPCCFSLLVPLLCLGCSGSSEDPPPGQELRSELQRLSADGVSIDDIAAQVAGNTVFALDVYRDRVAELDGDNFFFSPYSIQFAMAMTWAGARGSTESGMAAALHFVFDQEQLHPVFNYLDQRFNSDAATSDLDDVPFQLKVANMVFAREGLPIEASYLDTLALYYGTGLYMLDFVNDSKGCTAAINHWVAEVTERRIEDLLPEGAINAETRVVLVNAIYFMGAWEYPFDPMHTGDSDFHTGDGRTVSVPMMHEEEKLPHELGEGYVAVELPYRFGGLSMLIILPDENTFADFEQALSPADVERIHRAVHSGNDVNLTMPRWMLAGASFSLRDTLTRLGMGAALDASADFSGICSSDSSLQLGDVQHQAFIAVNEEGTEAAAATAVVMGRGSAEDPPSTTIILDRPFLYFILDNATAQILFMGRVTDPS